MFVRFILEGIHHNVYVGNRKKKPRLEPGPEVLQLSASDDSAKRPGKLAELNRQNRKFWDALSQKVEKQLQKPDIARRALENIERATLLGRPIRSPWSLESEVIELVPDRASGAKLTAHEQKIWKVIEQGGASLKGKMYCRELARAGVKPPMVWRDDGSPSTYPEAYAEGPPWRKRIQDEKSRIQKKGELSQLVKQKKSTR